MPVPVVLNLVSVGETIFGRHYEFQLSTVGNSAVEVRLRIKHVYWNPQVVNSA